MKPSPYRQWGSLFWWVGAFCIREVDRCCHFSWHRGYLPVSLPLFYVWLCLPWPSSMSGCIHRGVHYPPASMGIDVVPSALCTCSFWGLQPHHITWGLYPSSVDALVDVHGRSHNFLFFHPREALLVGHQVTALPFSSCGILFLSPLAEVDLCGVGLVHCPMYDGCPYTREANLWHDEKKLVSVEDLWPSVLLSHLVRGDICCNLMHHLPSLFFAPILDLPLSLKTICLH